MRNGFCFRRVAAFIGSVRRLPAGLAMLLLMSSQVMGQTLSTSERAAILLTTAKSAFNDQNYDAAAGTFREYLKLGAGPKLGILEARYGLGVCLIEGTTKDYRAAAESLSQAARLAGSKDRAFAFYYLGAAYRGLSEQADAVPETGRARRNRRTADQNLAQAAEAFDHAAEAFAARVPGEVSAANQTPDEWEWVAKARCDQADALLRTGQFKPALAAAEAAATDAHLLHSRYRHQAFYLSGYASFALKDYAAAVRSLSNLAPFEGAIGVHARYLLGRVHHLAGERPQAEVDYQAVIDGWGQRIKAAQAQLAANPPAKEKERLAALVKAPAPDYVARAMFYWGVAQWEFGAVDDSVGKFLEAVRLAPDSAIAPEARLRAAQAAVQVKRYQEAMSAVTPLVDDPRHGIEALRYLAKAQYGIGTTPVPKGKGEAAIVNAVPDPQALAAAIKQAIATLRKADERAKAQPATGTAMTVDRAMVLLDLGDMLQLDHQYKDAAAAYAGAAAGHAHETAEPALARRAIALQLAGELAESDRVCRAFMDNYPRGELRAEVGERYAENALLAAQRSTAAPGGNAGQEYAEATSRLNQVIAKYPDAPQANMARMGLATILYLRGDYAGAAAALDKIPESDRVDDLAGVGFLQADCRLRTLPEAADDALSSSRAAAELEKIITQLEAYAGSRPNSDESAQAMIRIGYASVKLANLLADPAEKKRTIAKARRAYVTFMQEFPDHPLYPVALLENAKILERIGAAPQAAAALSKFQSAPLDKTALAPLALIHLADAQRLRRQPREAISILTALRDAHEAELLKDPRRAQWVPTLRYGLALAYKEAGQYGQAKDLFANLAKDFPKRPEALEAAWRIAQCQTDPALAEVAENRRALAAGGKPAAREEIFAALLEANKKLRAATEEMQREADAIAAKMGDPTLPAKMNFDAAGCWKVVGEVEVEAAVRSMQAQALREMSEKLLREDPRASVSSLRPPDIELAAIPPQAGEKAARERFKTVIENGGDSPLVAEARLELAGLYLQRGENDAAVNLLKEAIAQDPNASIAERLRIRLAEIELAKGDVKQAAAIAGEVLSGPRSSYAAYARAIGVEAAYRQKDWNGVVSLAGDFLESERGAGRIYGVSDHALLRMADAQGQLGKWSDARATLDAWFKRFKSSPLAPRAHFTYGWVCEHLNDAAAAGSAYGQAAARSGGELGARANLQLGRLRLEQKRFSEAVEPLLIVAYAYDDPELSPAAMCAAAKALEGMNKPDDARRLLERAVKQYASSPWAAAAKKQMGEIK